MTVNVQEWVGQHRIDTQLCRFLVGDDSKHTIFVVHLSHGDHGEKRTFLSVPVSNAQIAMQVKD